MQKHEEPQDTIGMNKEDTNSTEDTEEIIDTSKLFKDEKSEVESIESDKKDNSKSTTNGRILYVAPTGKAAAVMRKRSKKAAYTIHQVLFSYRSWRLKKSGDEKNSEGSA